MTENLQVDGVQRRKPVVVLCCPKYLALRSAVENYSKFGTTDFEYEINGRKMKPSERQMRDPKLAFFGMNAVTAAAMEYSKENKELGLKAAGMVWKQQQEHRAVIECPAGENADSAQKSLDVITAEKRVRGMARQSVTPEQDYVRRSKEAKDQLALIGHEYESGKLSWWRGSQQYKDIGTKLVEITNAWKDYLQSEQTIQQSFEKTGEVNIIAQNTLKMNTDALLTKLDRLKKNNSAYFDHKIKDGEFVKGTNDNADKRIAIVQKIDRLADFLIETMNRKKKIIHDTVKAEKDRQQDKADNAEIIININAPADIKLPEENPPEIKNEVERLSNIIVKDPEDQIVNDGSAKENAEQVKPDNIIEVPKNEAPADNKTPYEKAIALLDKKRSDAQGRLNDLRNSGKQITKDAIKNDMAEIITSLFIEAHLKKPGKEDNKKSNIAPKLVDEKLYNMFLNNTLKGAAFNHVLDHSGLMALCIQATVGKGQNIWNTYEKRKEFLSKQPKNDNAEPVKTDIADTQKLKQPGIN